MIISGNYMKVSKEYRDYIADCLSRVGDIRIRSMMGGYLVYYRDRLAGTIGDGVFLVKRTPTSDRMLEGSQLELPYAESRTPMWLLENPEDTVFMQELFYGMYDELPPVKTKTRKKK